MLKQSLKLGRVFAILAICLHMVVAAVDGRICVKTAPQPTVVESCVSACCDDATSIDTTTNSSEFAVDHQLSPIAPMKTSCCLDVLTSTFATSINISMHKTSSRAFYAVLPNMGTPNVDVQHFQFCCRSVTLPPPSMVIIRSTVLRL